MVRRPAMAIPVLGALAVLLLWSCGSKAASIRDPVPIANPVNYEATLRIRQIPIQRVGAEFDVPVELINGGKIVCSVKARLSFPPAMLEVISLTPGTLFSMVVERKFNNTAGTVSYVAGAPGCTLQSTTLYTVRFRAKATGNAPIVLADTGVASVDNTGMPYAMPTLLIENTVWINNEMAALASRYPLLNPVLIAYLEQKRDRVH